MSDQITNAILIVDRHRDLYMNHPLFKHQVDNLVRVLIPVLLEGLAKEAEKEQARHDMAMSIIKQGVTDAGFRAGGSS